jgi:hypothetical protein
VPDAEEAIRAWVNSNPALVPQNGDPDSGLPISRGAYLRSQRSPADGPYLVIERAMPGGAEPPGVCEPAPELGTARIIARTYAGTEQASEAAATAYYNAVASAVGDPQPCGDTGTWVLSHDSLAGPAFISQGPTGGENYCFQVVAEFLLATY